MLKYFRMVLLSNFSDIRGRVVACWKEIVERSAGVCLSDRFYYGLIWFRHFSSILYRGMHLATAERAFFAAMAGAFGKNWTYAFG